MIKRRTRPQLHAREPVRDDEPEDNAAGRTGGNPDSDADQEDSLP